MIKRYQFGEIMLTIRRGETQYATSTTLERSVENNLRVVKQETDSLDQNETSYSLMEGDRKLAFIRGYFKSPTNFHIQVIENTTGDKISGFSYLPKVYRIMEKDLHERGVEYVTTLALVKLAHILVRRYGFYYTDEKSYKKLNNSWLKIIPWKAVSLEKRL